MSNRSLRTSRQARTEAIERLSPDRQSLFAQLCSMDSLPVVIPDRRPGVAMPAAPPSTGTIEAIIWSYDDEVPSPPIVLLAPVSGIHLRGKKNQRAIYEATEIEPGEWLRWYDDGVWRRVDWDKHIQCSGKQLLLRRKGTTVLKNWAINTKYA
uniref:Uncharacterized protein n=1 Tax=Mycena chlorophos TaxID=658473 RepID=A0ABQ0KX59_MYCCL|nr:predicted protein [Mycena chlorophos]